MSELADLIAEQSEKMTEDTDYFPEGASMVVTRGSKVEGNTVTVVFHMGEDGDGLVLGFDDETFDKVASDFARESTNPWCQLYPSDYQALDTVLREASHLLGDSEINRLEMLRDAAPEPEGGGDDECTLGDFGD